MEDGGGASYHRSTHLDVVQPSLISNGFYEAPR